MSPSSAVSSTSLRWVVSWSASVQGPYPTGNAAAQPDMRLAFPAPAAGALDQSFRLVLKPELWGRAARMRFSNALGLRPVTFAGAFVGMHHGSSAVLAGTNRRVTFGGAARVTVAAGESAWSDPVDLDFVRDPDAIELAGRKLAVSFHVEGESGPMTWHAKALQTSYVSFPGAGAKGHDETEEAFPLSANSWFFLDVLDMLAPEHAYAIVALGDSITDGTLSTLNGDDRWPDVLSRRLRARHGNHIAVVNAGIGGNQVIGPADYFPAKPFSGGPSALARLERDVLSLSGVGAVIWLEGINDFSKNGNASVAAVCSGLRDGVHAIRERFPGVKVVGGTVTTALNATQEHHGFRDEDEKRRALNEFIRTSGLFDHIADFDAAVTDPSTGEMRAEFVHNTTVGGPGDKLHPNRLGYLAMGMAIDTRIFDSRF
ncbi:MAG: GDSL-type esterase/lipase family protein [Pseudomonadota bacterium]